MRTDTLINTKGQIYLKQSTYWHAWGKCEGTGEPRGKPRGHEEKHAQKLPADRNPSSVESIEALEVPTLSPAFEAAFGLLFCIPLGLPPPFIKVWAPSISEAQKSYCSIELHIDFHLELFEKVGRAVQTEGFYSTYYLVQKQDGSFHPDLRGLNQLPITLPSQDGCKWPCLL